MSNVTTANTQEFILSFSITFINTTADIAGLRSVPGVNKDHRHTLTLGFVQDKLGQLMEGPTMQIVTLIAPKPYPSADAFKLFQGNRSICAFGNVYHLLADYVVSVGCKTPFLARQLFEFAPGRLGANLLNFLTLSASPAPDVVEVVASVPLAVTGSGDVFDTKINAQNVGDCEGVSFLDFTSSSQIEVATDQQEVAFALLPGKLPMLSAPADERDFQPPLGGPERDVIALKIVAKDASVVGNAAGEPEGTPGLAVELVGVNHLGNTAHSSLGRQLKLLAHVVVDQFVQLVSAKGALLPGQLTDVVASGVGHLKSVAKGGCLGLGWLEFNLGC